VCQLRPMLLRVRVLVIVLYQAAEDKPNGSSLESGPGTLVRYSSAAQLASPASPATGVGGIGPPHPP
jgi:hypothetical protein